MIFVLFLLFAGYSNNSVKHEKYEKPNMLVMLADDLGWRDIGYYNLENVYTPNLDKLSEKAITFSKHYVMPKLLKCTGTVLHKIRKFLI